jgi:NAD(P)H-hydrate epimerase
MATIPYLTTSQMREADRVMLEDYRIELIQMMENAGRNLAHLARTRFLNGAPHKKTVIVLAGSGGNGGGGMVCARHLHNWGAVVRVITSLPDALYRGIPAHQLDILRRMGVPITTAAENTSIADRLPDAAPVELIVDAVIGYSLSGEPRGTAAQMIAWANARNAPVLSLDTPSGIDTTSGQVFNPVIRATATLTLALPKEGLRAPGAAEHVGELYLADISIPPDLYAGLGLVLPPEPIFSRAEIIRLPVPPST